MKIELGDPITREGFFEIPAKCNGRDFAVRISAAGEVKAYGVVTPKIADLVEEWSLDQQQTVDELVAKLQG